MLILLLQGVRREVGNHAKVLNKVLAKIHVNSVHTKDRENMIDSQPGTSLPQVWRDLGPSCLRKQVLLHQNQQILLYYLDQMTK